MHEVFVVAGGIALAYGLYVVGSFLIALLVLPAFINMFNGFGYWYNAMRLLGIKKEN